MATFQWHKPSDLFVRVNFQGYSNPSPSYDCVATTSAAVHIGDSLTYCPLTPNDGTYFQRRPVTNPRSKCDSTNDFDRGDTIRSSTYTGYAYNDDSSTSDDLDSPIQNYKFEPDFLVGTIFSWKDSPP